MGNRIICLFENIDTALKVSLALDELVYNGEKINNSNFAEHYNSMVKELEKKGYLKTNMEFSKDCIFTWAFLNEEPLALCNPPLKSEHFEFLESLEYGENSSYLVQSKRLKGVLSRPEVDKIIIVGSRLLFREIAKQEIGREKIFSHIITTNKTIKDITDEINEASKRLDPLVIALVDAAKTRDIVEYNLRSSLNHIINKTFNTNLSLDIYSLYIINELCEQNRKQATFKPATKYKIKAKIKYNNSILIATEVKKIYSSKEIAENIARNIPEEIKSISLKSSDERVPSPTLFNNALLLSEARKEFKYDEETTNKLAESLYKKNYITDPNTSHTDLYLQRPENFNKFIESVINIYKKCFPTAKVPATNEFKLKKYTNIKSDCGIVLKKSAKTDISELTKDELNIYALIVKQILLSTLPDSISEKYAAEFVAGGKTFRVTGKKIKVIGFKALGEIPEDTNVDFPKSELKTKATYNVESSTTQKPANFTKTSFAKLCQSLQNEYGNVISPKKMLSDLISGGYLSLSNKNIYPTENSFKIWSVVLRHIDELKNNVLFEELTSSVTQIEEKKLKPDECIDAYKVMISKWIDKFENLNPGILPQKCLCPGCNNQLSKNSFGIHCNICDFSLPVNLYGRRFTQDELIDFAEKKKTPFLRNLSDGDKHITARLVLNEENQVELSRKTEIKCCFCNGNMDLSEDENSVECNVCNYKVPRYMDKYLLSQSDIKNLLGRGFTDPILYNNKYYFVYFDKKTKMTKFMEADKEN